MSFTGYRLLLAICALAWLWLPGSRAEAATEWQSLLSEDFSQGEVSFYTGQASEAFYGIDDQNRYIIDGLNTEIDSLSALTKNLYYYYVESECELIDTRIGEMAFCGLVFHYNKKIPGKLAYYVFYIYADGYYGAKRVIGDSAEVILPLTKSDYIDIGRPNVLAVDARGTRFDLHINGRYVDGFTDVRIDGGGFGFYVSQQARAAFDNFEVKVERRGGGPAEVEGPELLEGSSEDGGSRASGSQDEKFGGYDFPDIPKDPNRPLYPWEVGVDKSETARRERTESRERELADLAQKRLEDGLADPQLEEQKIVRDEPVPQEPVPEESAVEQPAAAGESQQETAAGEQPAAGDETFTNVSLSDDPAAEPDNGEAPQTETADANKEERSSADIMEEVRRDSGDDWPLKAPPYSPQDPPQEAGGSEQSGEEDPTDDRDPQRNADGSLKGIELPPLDIARPPAGAGSQEQAEPVEDADGQAQEASEDVARESAGAQGEETGPVDSDGPLSLFPDQAADGAEQAGPGERNVPDPSDVLGPADGNPGELKLPSDQTANDASREYDPFEGNPDVESVYDDFTEQRWPVADGDTSSYRYFGAAYEIDNTKSDTMAISYQQASFMDARYGIDVEYLGGLDYVGYGLAARFSVRNGNVSYYGMFVSQSGEFLLLKVQDGKEIVLRDWSSAPNLSRTLSNRIGLELIGSSIQCIINGEVVATVTDDSLDGGGYALLCGPGTSTRFDNLTIKGLVAEGV